MSSLRANAIVVGCVVSAALALGCESEHEDHGELAERDAGVEHGSLCTPERDFCDDGGERIDSRAAFARVRARLAEGQLILVMSGASGTLNVDGFDTDWDFELVDDNAHREQRIGVHAGVVDEPQERGTDYRCDDGEELQLLDSSAVVPDAVLRIESRIGAPFSGNLFLEQLGCRERPEHNVRALLRDGSQWYFARYLGDGRFLELVGPCTSRDLDACSRGD